MFTWVYYSSMLLVSHRGILSNGSIVGLRFSLIYGGQVGLWWCHLLSLFQQVLILMCYLKREVLYAFLVFPLIYSSCLQWHHISVSLINRGFVIRNLWSLEV